ncbi:MAG: hypothetical protein GY712_00540, partial [Oceanicoccus sp.]|uniref:hypothetical protein n=1 Tax=Oceanicoccus sp. TaxID=2691044 RepID=UPI00260310A3
MLNSRNLIDGNTTHLQRVANVIFWLAVIYVCWYKLWLSSALPFTIPMFSDHDGKWFLKAALSIYKGEWFGSPYTHFTLIKSPVYPVFLSFLANTGIHPKLAIDLLYVGASLVFLSALRSAIHNRLAVFLGFVIVLANPIAFSEYWATLLRLNLFMPLVLIYLSSILALIAHASKDEPRISLPWSLVCALSLAVAWYTREEAIWMISALAPMVLITFLCFFKKKQRLQVLVFWLLVVLLPNLLGQYFSSINKERYGFDGIADTRAPEFSRAISAIYSLNTANDGSYRYFTFETRDKLKSISENTLRVIEPLLDSEHGGYTYFNDGIGGGFASWAIRDSMYHLGYYRDPERTELAYKEIADDIEEFCLQKAENCRKTYVPGVLVKPVSWKRFSTEIQSGVIKLVQFTPYEPADRLAEKDRGDSKYQYLVSRLFNFSTSWDEELEQRAGILNIEKKRIRRIGSIYSSYKDGLFFLLLATLVGCSIAIFFSKKMAPKLAGLLFVGSFAGSYSVYLLISLYAVPGFPRLLAIVSIPLLGFTAYFL